MAGLRAHGDNAVHRDDHWRQRIRNEKSANANWQSCWGFLETQRAQDRALPDMNMDDDAMIRTRAAIAPVSRYLRHRHQLAKVEARTRSADAFSGAVPSGNGTPRVSSSGTLSRSIPILPPLSVDAMIPPPTPAGTDNRPSTPLFLDTHQGLHLSGAMLQSVGQSLKLPGVDPVVKYRFPQTSSQHVGWRAHTTLEQFGVNGHGKRGL